ncbi:hypothetical protein NDU88_000308 [Pleurodeles waltl]|uniref:Uncharacterized protein n=1 Tax=Pleurodeles waltl TaxID=8319 RepID=A0AAV7TER2_PLEWA|nr:hypothetical protein NDU88_000308 [Pleurodeles waltl]
MELELNNSDNLKLTELKKLCKERGLNVVKTALRAFEEVFRMHAATEKQQQGDPDDEKVDMEDENEEGNGLATGPELQP